MGGGGKNRRWIIVQYASGEGLHLCSRLNVFSTLILLRHKRLEGADSETAGAAWESVGECGGDASSERGDGVWDVALGAQGRIVRVRDRGERKMFGRARRRDVLRGVSSAVRRSGNRKRRCTAWRDGGSS